MKFLPVIILALISTSLAKPLEEVAKEVVKEGEAKPVEPIKENEAVANVEVKKDDSLLNAEQDKPEAREEQAYEQKLQMVCIGLPVRALENAAPLGRFSDRGDHVYQGRLPVHSTASATTHLFVMDARRGTYTFGYDTGGGEHQSYRVETRSADGRVTGRYGYVDPNGVLRVVDYVADHRGFRPILTTRYPVSRSPSFIGPIPSPIIYEESRLKTRKIPFANPVVAASLFNQIHDSDLFNESGSENVPAN